MCLLKNGKKYISVKMLTCDKTYPTIGLIIYDIYYIYNNNQYQTLFENDKHQTVFLLLIKCVILWYTKIYPYIYKHNIYTHLDIIKVDFTVTYTH